jgi:predicted CxxxxCH...CXXCH cytochrome family protein
MRCHVLALAAVSALAAACSESRSREVIGLAQHCDGCHAAPPATGAHLVHANPSSPKAFVYGSLHVLEDVAEVGGAVDRYDFGCGNCHPLDLARHYAHTGAPGVAEVVLDPAGAPSGTLKARNAPGAAYDPATGTCSGVACHSSGQASPTYVRTPPWTSPAGTLGCDGCHGNPPRYPSGGAGAPDANSHVGLDVEGGTTAWEFGHFAGLPGPNHGSKHGGGGTPNPVAFNVASPITCQACHFETVDPANVLPDGAFYFDATGVYSIAGGDAGRVDTAQWQDSQCVTCHQAPDRGRGRALPLRHVNGRRDVDFDPRTSIPTPVLFPAVVGAAPLRPYYMTLSGRIPSFDLAPATCATSPVPSCGVATDVAVRDFVDVDPSNALSAGQLLTLTLTHARYDPQTKTCSSVACHLERQRQLDTAGEVPTMTPLRWGTPYLWGDPSTCNGCHQR